MRLPVLLLLLFTSACAATSATDPHAACLLFAPLTWSSRDTEETQRQIFSHNLAWEALCEPQEPKE